MAIVTTHYRPKRAPRTQPATEPVALKVTTARRPSPPLPEPALISHDETEAEGARAWLERQLEQAREAVMSRDREELVRFVRQGKGIREVLQAVESALVGAGYDDFTVATDHGTWQWTKAPEPPEGQ